MTPDRQEQVRKLAEFLGWQFKSDYSGEYWQTNEGSVSEFNPFERAEDAKLLRDKARKLGWLIWLTFRPEEIYCEITAGPKQVTKGDQSENSATCLAILAAIDGGGK